MGNEIIIDVQQEAISVALLKDDRVVEFIKEDHKSVCLVGNIFIGTVKKIMPGLNAAFVDIGQEKEGFLHYLDLGKSFSATNDFIKNVLADRKRIPEAKKVETSEELDKEGNIANILTTGQKILVQIIKEPISTKGARLTGEISLAGRNVVMLPFQNKTTVSQKISSKEERNRLRNIVNTLKTEDYGIIIRTVAEGKKATELDNELKLLTKRWENAIQSIRKSRGNELILEEINRTETLLRDVFNPNFENIYINDKDVYKEICDYVALIAPECKSIVKFYNDDTPIFDHFAITKQVKSLFGRTVSFKRGAYLIIEHTEALTVIDVNSGNRTRSSKGQEENALEVNLAAAEEIAHQIRLRDIGGIIVIDFIDLADSDNRQILFDYMTQLMSEDRARHNILPLSKFCLMQITRHRVRPAIAVDVEETCPTCFGKGKTTPSILFTDQLEDQLDFLATEKNYKHKKVILQVHPYIEAYLKKGFPSLCLKWRFKYKIHLKVQPIQSFGFLQYRFLSATKEEIDLHE